MTEPTAVLPLLSAPPVAAPTAAAPAHLSRWRADLAWVAAATLGSWVLASAIELRELSSGWLAPFESWQADELPLAFTVLALGLAWYATRRRRETLIELQLRQAAQDHATMLLAHNRELARQLITLQETERLALARELHDELGQSCSAIRAEAAYIRHCAADDHAAVLAAADRADAAAQGLYEGVRGLLRRLRPPKLDSLGLVAAVQELCAGWSERSGLPCHCSAEGLEAALPDAVNIALYRVAQEALTNVLQHARASTVHVALARTAAGELQLSVQDNGRGIGDIGSNPSAARGLGLLGASERAAALGGELSVQSLPGDGTRLLLRIPQAALAQAGAAA